MTTVQVREIVPGRAPVSRVAGAPRLPHRYLPRPDLWSRLDVATRSAVTVVVAPAGAGKTLAVAGWLERSAREHDVSWVDGERTTTRHGLAAVLEAARRGSTPAPVVTTPPTEETEPLRHDPLPCESLSDLEDEALCQAWRRSFRLLEGTTGIEELAFLAELRGRYLDELDRRHPDGVSRWLASGARAAGNPLPYLADSDGSP